MLHDPKTAANELINRGIAEEEPLIHVEVQNLLYFCHGWMLGIHGQPLHEGLWEAWQYGPILPDVYYNLTYYDDGPITAPILAHPEEFTDAEKSIMDSVYTQYRPYREGGMVNIVHGKGTPWHKVWNRKWGSLLIPNESIQSYFAKKYREYSNSHAA